jgi:hypothetical protein
MAEDAFCENVSSPAKMFRKRDPKKHGEGKLKAMHHGVEHE